jgi:hypothetical protein
MEVSSMTVQSEALRERLFSIDKAAAFFYTLMFVVIEGGWIGFLGWALYKFT